MKEEIEVAMEAGEADEARKTGANNGKKGRLIRKYDENRDLYLIRLPTPSANCARAKAMSMTM